MLCRSIIIIVLTFVSFAVGETTVFTNNNIIRNMNLTNSIHYIGNLTRAIQNNDIIIICGKIKPDGERFLINLQDTKNNISIIPLHLSVRVRENFIARNSKGKTFKWDNEDRSENLYPHVDPLGGLVSGGYFNFQIFVMDDKYDIAINGKLFAVFHHRIPITYANTINIENAETITNIAHISTFPNLYPNCVHLNCMGNTNYAFQTYFPNNLQPGSIISIIGKPTGSTAGGFAISFTENNSQKEVFHFNPRFEIQFIIRNAMQDDLSWGCEEDDGPFPFAIDQQFKLVFGFTEHSFKYAINGVHVGNFNHRQRNLLNSLNGLFINAYDGTNIAITSVDYAETAQPNLEDILTYSIQ